MSDALAERLGRMSPDQLVRLVDGLQGRIDALRRRVEAPIAVVGLALRLPGASTPDRFWRLLCDGEVAIAEVPPERWDAAPLAADGVPRWGGFIGAIDGFDAGFFRIPPAEAATMDPQQRLAAEIAWEALENAGYSLGERRPRATGVFLGVSTDDYKGRFIAGDAAAVDPRMATGTANSALAGRLSYLFDLGGPSLVVDTACSSSLVAAHLACRSLRAGECDMALAGGVGLLLEPELTVAFARLGMLSPRGLCSTFAEEADGYVRGEGAAMLVLRRFDDARRDGDPVLAVIRGSAVNQDGRSNGLTAPNGSAQREVIAAALADAGIAAAEVDAVECHGTATPLGDPIEIIALGDAYGTGRAADAPLLLGSVKANIGHLEAAAGAAGLAKAVLALAHRMLPPQPAHGPLNPRVDWRALPVRIADAPTPLDPPGRPARIAVSSFGFAGTNAHMILEAASAPETAPAEGPHLIALSARSAAGLAELAQTVGEALSHPASLAGNAADIARNLVLDRRLYPWRCAAAGSDPAALAAALASAAQAATAPADSPPRIAFLFTGQGSQWPGMARVLYAREPAFRAAFDECAALLRPHLETPLADLVWSADPDGRARLDQTGNAQPALFAIEYALAVLWRHWGVRPDVMVGHSIGEYAAACLAGVMDLADAAALVAARGRLMQSLPAGGGMMALAMPEAEAATWLSRHPALELAAVNAAATVAIAGPLDALEALAAELPAGVGTRLRVSHAFHSRLMEPILARFGEVAARVRLRPPQHAIVSTVTGAPAGDELADPAYWVRQLRAPVRFAAAAEALGDIAAAVEIGPRPVLLSLLPQGGVRRLPSLRDNDASDVTILHSLADLFAAGVEIDWKAFHADRAGRRAPALPTPFARERYWTERPRKEALAAPAPVPAPTPAPTAQPAPAIDTLDVLRGLVAEAMRLPAQSIPADIAFVELGADSLILMQVATGIERRFGVTVPRRELFASLDTLTKLHAHVAAATPAVSLTLTPAPAAPAPTIPRPAAPAPPRPAAAAEKPAARAHVAALAERLRTKTPGSWQSRAATGRELADSRASAGYRPEMQSLIYPLVGDRAEGAHIWDVDGNEYLDITMGFGVQLFGHSAPFIRDALAGQLGRGLQLGPQARLAGEVAARLHRLTGVERVAFCNTGTEAVMTALRLARLATGHAKVALFQGSYHGHFDGVLASSADAAGAAMPLSLGTPQAFAQDLLILDYGDPDASFAALERHRGELAAVLVEPIQSRRPALQPRVFLRALREWTERAGVALIFDEVLLGFRIALGGAQAWAGVEADLVTYGKIIGGGLPIGVVAGRRAMMDGLDGGAWQPGANAPNEATIFFAGTFNKNPLTMAASIAVLDRLEREGPELQEGLNRRTAALVARLNAALAERTPILRVDSAASLFRFRGAPDVFYYELLDRGVYVWEGRTCFLSTEHTEADLDRVVAAVAASADALVAAELLPGLDVAPAPVVAAAPAEESWPMTAQQRSLWLVCQIGETVSAAYNQSLRITFADEPDRAALARALDRLVGRHPSLRARFDFDGQTMRAGPAAPVRLTVLEGDVDAAEHDLCWEPFDLETGPMLRVATAATEDGWRLTLVLPHLVIDGWSFAVLVEELATLYRAELAGVAAVLPPADPPAAYASAVAPGAADPASAQAWLARFSPPPAPLDLPTLGPRPRAQGYRGGRVTHSLGSERLARLRALCRREGVGLAAAGLAAYALLLGRLGRSDDLAIGLLSAGQPVRGLPRLVGYCANLLPVRIALAPSATLSELLALCQRAIDEAVDGRDYPFAELVRALRLPRDPSRPPLVSAGFNFDRIDGAPDFGTAVRFDANFHGAVRWDLFFNLVAGPDDIELQADFSAGLFDAAQVDAWADEYLALLDRFHDAPHAPLAPPAILARVAEHASRRGNIAAVEDGAVSLSYGELWREAGGLAVRLRVAGAKPGDVVAADLGRNAAMLVAMLGIWRAGMVFMPVEPSYPADYRRRLIADSGAVCRLCAEGAKEPGPIPSLVLTLGDVASDSDLFAPPDPETAAYLVYTSGSTGTPKGILVPHRALAAYAAAVLERLDIPADPGDAPPWRFALVSSFAADLGYTCVLGALASGGTLRVFQQDEMRDPAGFAAAMAAVDVLKIVPTHLSALLEWPEPTAILPARRLVLGGEASHWPLIERVWRLAPSCRVFNHYGPAETTIGVTCIELTPALRAQSPEAVPLGYALGHATVRIEPSDDGDDTGEILIGGAGVSLGYLSPDAPENARFEPDRNGPAGARLYRTGDRGRRLPDGLFMFLGRLDEEVKIRGHRVAPAAVAAMLRGCPGIRDAAALAEIDGKGRARLLAFVAGPASLSETEMRRWAAANLPPAMVPDAIVRLDELPRTANGKVDRDRLRTARPAEEAAAEATAGSGGALLAIWRDILGVPEAGPDDDFFALGGDSIMAIQIAGRARAIGLRFNAQILFEHPTVNELLAAAAPAAVTPPQGTPQHGTIPLTPVQRGFFELRSPKPGHWGLSAILRLPPEATAEAVRQALPRVVGRHRALRLRFTGEGEEARQDLAAVAVLAPLATLDHRRLDDAARRQAEDEAATTLVAGIELTSGVLLGAALIDRGAGENPALLVAVHHLVFDAVSWQVFADDLFAALDPAAEPAEAPGFDAWCRLLPAEAERRVGEMPHWQAVEARIAPVLPRLPNPGANLEGNVAREAIRLPAAATAALRRAATAQQAGVQDATLAALLAALAQWAPQGVDRRVVVDLEGHGREEIDPSLDLSRIVGWFTTHFPVAFDPVPEAAAGAQIAAVREALRAVPGRGLGYGLLRYLRPGSSLGRDPEISFNFLGTIGLGADPAARFERVSVGVERDPGTPRRHLLVVEAYVADGRLSIELLYAREAISAGVAAAIRDAMTDWFVSLTVAHPVPPSTTLPDHLALTEDDLRALNNTLGLGK